MDRLKDKVAVITGAGHGQGAAGARRFASEGAAVVVADLNSETAEAVAAEITAEGGRASAVTADVSDPSDVEAMVEHAVTQFGKLDVLYNNAGVMLPGAVDEYDVDRWNRQWAVNVTGVFLCSKYAIPHLRKSGGVIVNTASTSGLVGEQGNAPYCATKGAIVNFTRALAVDLAREGIRVNCICPGWIDTGFNDPFIEELGGDEVVVAALDAYVPMNRQGRAEEIAEVALFLASDASSLMTGAIVPVDAGLTAM
jgi:meso-butanediol dehydrogenase / (S,S)-butanediol dehydrogenase / diacetyl reductase